LAGARADVCCDNHKSVIVYGIPETFLLWPPIGGEIELDSIRWKDERKEEEEEREPEETRHGECGETNESSFCNALVANARIRTINPRLLINLVQTLRNVQHLGNLQREMVNKA
jgi:hypothetical protein